MVTNKDTSEEKRRTTLTNFVKNIPVVSIGTRNIDEELMMNISVLFNSICTYMWYSIIKLYVTVNSIILVCTGV